jgi:uncharacterized protein YndB with AHSA1/START domain
VLEKILCGREVKNFGHCLQNILLKSVPLKHIYKFYMSKIQFEIEYLVHSSAHILYNCISNPSSLEEWFADSVNQKGDSFQFKWDDEDRNALLLSSKKNQHIRWQWNEKEFANTYFEMRIKVDEMTNEVALIITDYCEEGDQEDAKMLWDLAIDDLHRVIGR